ncbi:MAG TPA: alpha/beta hydrolase-fold protein [Alphaproteobacteria bacterium]|nr:alpha/beta hydrolase-fold protein [Alphaproteobacteria bacterium]
MRRNRDLPRGRIERLEIESEVLRGNLQGDPDCRELHVYLPPGRSDGAGLPLLVDLVGFTGSGMSHTNWKNFGENVPERLDRLIGEGTMGPVVVAFPDCFTRLGGNQYVNSTAVGRYEDYLLQEVVPFVERRFSCGGAGRRGVFGKSSGGYGAIVHAMRHGGFWSAAACHSGDMGFELTYGLDIPTALNELAKHGRSISAFLAHFEKSPKPTAKETQTLMFLAMAATYDPDPSQPSGIRLPCDPETGELIADRWAKWLAHDPLVLAERSVDSLKRLKALFIDCGDRDQYHLHFGSRRLHRTLDRLGVPHHYEEFSDDHSNIDYRLDHSLPFLERALR